MEKYVLLSQVSTDIPEFLTSSTQEECVYLL